MKQDNIYLKHILTEIKYLVEKSEFISFEDFFNDETLKRSFTRSIEIIGEATKNISEEFRNEIKEIEWKKLAGMRNKLIHHYFGVDYYVVWDFVKNKIPDLRRNIENKLDLK